MGEHNKPSALPFRLSRSEPSFLSTQTIFLDDKGVLRPAERDDLNRMLIGGLLSLAFLCITTAAILFLPR